MLAGKLFYFPSDDSQKDTHMNLFDILSHNERVIVYSDKEDKHIYTWNKSLTLQCWEDKGSGIWEEKEVRTLSNRPANFNHAVAAAVVWHNQ